MQILLVEDDRSIREVFKVLLEVEAPFDNVEVLAASSGAEALAALRRGPTDVVLLDLTMPDEDGFEVFEKIRALPGCERVPVIAVTAHNLGELRAKAERMGFAGFVTKPIDMETALFPLIRRAVTQARAA